MDTLTISRASSVADTVVTVVETNPKIQTMSLCVTMCGACARARIKMENHLPS